MGHTAMEEMDVIDLKTLHTRQLLLMLKESRFYRNDVPDIDLIKAELATREHVPNKKEGQAIRRARAKAGR